MAVSTFDKIIAKLPNPKSTEAEIVDFYKTFWENGVALNGEDYQQVVGKLKKISKKSALSNCLFILTEGFSYIFFPNYGNAYEKLTEAIAAFQQINDKQGEGAAQSLIAIYFKNIGQLEKAQRYTQNAIQNIQEDKTYIYFLGISYYQAGEVHHLLKDYNAAINFFKTGLTYTTEGISIHARMLNGIGTVYRDTNELDLAFEFFQKSLKLIEGQNNYIIESKIYSDIGNYYVLKGDFEQALLFQEKSIQIRKEHKFYHPLITNYTELAEIYLKQNKIEEALESALLVEKLSLQYNVKIKLYHAYLILSTIYEQMGKTGMALDYYKKHTQVKDEVLNQESARKIKQLSMHHEIETMQNEKEIFKLRNVVLKAALDEIEASVRYAQRIQAAILPPIELIKEKLPNTFVLYKPKDVVAGDFYWMEEIGDTLLIAAADCTGHGVPGALVSVVCSNALNRAVKEFGLSDTGKILDKVTDLVLETFEKSREDVKDVMDISLLSINKTSKQIYWSGAMNSLWYFTNDVLTEVPADKQPIGKSDNRKPFTKHSVDYKPGTSFYLVTDGYADQFGGPNGKKLMYKKLKEILSSTTNKPAELQHETLNTYFQEWKGDLEQIYDVCVIGIRI